MRTPVSIVCVYNDPAVLASCLDASITRGLPDAPETEFLPVDNRSGQFATAGGALNHGARQARNEVVVFVHQDVVLHSLPALEEAAGAMVSAPDVGVLGSVGIDGSRRVVGRIRDRVVLIGDSAPGPRNIDTLDEVLFMVRREQVLRSPLAETPELAWHAYAVEYSARVRREGRRATVMNIPITHNSLTTNLDRLEVAHRWVGDAYPELLPIITTCGTIHRDSGPRESLKSFRRARGAQIWWQESLTARRVARLTPKSRVVLADIRLAIDDAVGLAGMETIRALDIRRDGTPTSVDGLERFGRAFSAASVTLAAANDEIAARNPGELLLVGNLVPDDVPALDRLRSVPHVIGFWRDTGLWVLVGAAPERLTTLWSTPRNRPFAGLLDAEGFRAHQTSTRDGVQP